MENPGNYVIVFPSLKKALNFDKFLENHEKVMNFNFLLCGTVKGNYRVTRKLISMFWNSLMLEYKKLTVPCVPEVKPFSVLKLCIKSGIRSTRFQFWIYN
ncbi:hypothetical protein KUTeg_014161 [Tegillarca granosa]|uniref:Uncharacterized protein n=1 Tax=Tegillarca granosa TaxID=220873 RepID=A0ABQ9EZA6_TEGGR|nr:hypothetical protein KUTeg_014161 [Tegillarca granosa]